jgi:O-antigen/teichoic acid export membrane protein
MEELSRIRKNSFFYFISISTRLVTNAILFIIVARYYGAEIYGGFTSSYSLSMLLLILADFGFDLLIVSDISKHREDAVQIFNKYFPFKIILSLLAFIILNSLVFILPLSIVTQQLIFFFSFNMVFTAIMNMFLAFFRGIERFEIEAVISSIVNFLIFICVLVMSFYRLNVLFIAFSISLIRLLGGALAFRKLYQLNVRLTFENTLVDFMETGKRILIFGLHLVFGTLYFQLDTVLIISMKGDAAAGIYQASFRLLLILLIVPELIVGASFPTLSRLFSTNNENWIDTNKLILKILLVLAIPLALILFVFPDHIISIIYSSKEYSSAAPLLAISGIILLVRFLAEPFAMCLTITNKQWSRTKVVIIATILNLGINLFLIPKWGINAAIWISLGTNIFTLFGYAFSLKSMFKKLVQKSNLVLSFVFLIGSLFVLNQLKSCNFFVIVTLFLIFYSLFAFLLLFNTKERSMITKLFMANA